MKLRNKKTGQEGNFIINKDHFECVDLDCVPLYFSLSGLLDEWEDYKPKEPLIKDEKIRKAVRAWAYANGLHNMPIYYDANENRFCDDRDFSIAVDFYRDIEGELNGGYSYYLTELCGGEEE